MVTGRVDAPATLTVVVQVAAVLLAAALLLVILAAMPGVVHLRRARPAGLLKGWENAVRGDLFAAWPQGRDHGSDLLAELDRHLTDVPVVAVARNRRIAALYARHGLIPVAPGNLVHVRGPKGPRRPNRPA